MKQQKTKIAGIALFLASLLIACGDRSGGTDAGNVSADSIGGETTAAPAEETYPYAIEVTEGAFRILNCIDDWWTNMNHIMDYEENQPDMVADAVYTRNRKIENDMGITVSVIKEDYEQLYALMRQGVEAGDDAYDVCYLPLCAWGSSTIIGGGYQINLYDIPELHLDAEWWNASFISSMTVGSGGDEMIYAVSDYANLCGYSYTGMLFFNKDMMRTLGMDMPYDAVRNGTWTYDLLFTEYAKQAANLNGAQSFKTDSTSPAIWGLGVQHAEGPLAMINGSGSFLVEKNGDNMPEMNASLARLSDVYDKLLGHFSQDGNAIMVNESDVFSAKTLFMNSQELFFYQTIGMSLSPDFRGLELEYGMLPIPKYDAAQEQYHSHVSEYALAMNIPASVTDPARVGKIVDYMEYLSYTELFPIFYEALCYKGIRDEDSIAMLEIINNSQTADIGYLYGFTTDLMNSLCNNILGGKNTFASNVEKQTKNIEKKIADLEFGE